MPAGFCEEGVVLSCPGCGAAVADGEAICPKCDYIIDPDAFSAEPPEADDAPPAPEPKSAPPKGPRGPKSRPPPGRRPSGKSASASPSSTQLKSREEIEKARTAKVPGRSPSRKSSMPDAPSRRGAAAVPASSTDWRTRPEPASSTAPSTPSTSGYSIAAPEDVLNDAKSFVANLPRSDKLAFVGVAANVLFCFFPWKETVVDGEVLGLMSLGFPVFAVSILALVTIVVRVRKVLPKLNPLAPWALQLVAVCFCIVWCLIFIKLSYDGRMAKSPVGNFDMRISSPSFGVFITFITSLLAAGGTLMGLKEKSA